MVFEQLRADLEAQGWTIQHALDGDVQKVIRAAKGERELIALVLEQQGATRVVVRAALD